MKFNINGTVRVQLRQKAVDILRMRHEELRREFPSVGDFEPPKPEADGWVRYQLWEVMQIFGPHIGMSRVTPFETTIEIEVE